MLRKAAAELLPPIVHRPLANFWHGVSAYTYEGSYPSLEAVPVKNHPHHDPKEVEKSTQIALGRLSEAPSASSEDDGRWILPLLVSQFAGQRLTILDFGGGSFTGWDRIKGHLPFFDHSLLKYVLVEQPLKAQALQKTITHPQFLIEDHIPDSLDAPLIVSASSVLQYITDYPKILRRFATLAPEHIVISLTPVSDLPTYARIECNHPHSRFGSLVLNRAEIIDLLGNRGYPLSFVIDHEHKTTHKHAPGPSVFTSMVFSKKTASP